MACNINGNPLVPDHQTKSEKKKNHPQKWNSPGDASLFKHKKIKNRNGTEAGTEFCNSIEILPTFFVSFMVLQTIYNPT